MRALITGGEGFVGRYLQAWLRRSGDEVAAPEVDVTDARAVQAALDDMQPGAVYHLAAVSVPRHAEADADVAMAVNAGGARNVLTAAAATASRPTVLVTSSAAVYAPADHPLTENAPTRAANAYVASKLEAEDACAEARDAAVKVIVVRPFNHTGPGQPADLVVPALAQGVATAVKHDSGVVDTGNLDVRRDIGDVRDVVRAYRLAVERAPAGIYNVCTGRAVLLSDVARELAELAGRPDLEFRVVPERMRGDDPAIVVGDGSKFSTATSWQPELDLRTTLADVLAWWEARL